VNFLDNDDPRTAHTTSYTDELFVIPSIQISDSPKLYYKPH